MQDNLDELLAGAAPAVCPFTPDAEAAIAAIVADARVASLRDRRTKVARKVGGAVAVVALMAAGTAAAAGVLQGHENPWGGPSGANAEALGIQDFEWTATHPVGRQCVERLEAKGLSAAQVADITAELSDPEGLLAKDGGAVRQEFLDKGWSDGSDADLATMDAAYAEVARLDFAAGRGTLRDDELTDDYLDGRAAELFANVYWRVILDGIESDDAVTGNILGPLTLCEVTK